jgi:hypothetical protein
VIGDARKTPGSHSGRPDQPGPVVGYRDCAYAVSVTDEPDAPFSVRIGARLPDRELWEGVPDWLLDPLLDWLEEHVQRWSIRELALRHRLNLLQSDSPKRALRDALMVRARESERGRWDILDAIDFLCQHDPDHDLSIPAGWIGGAPVRGSEPLAVLNGLLASGGSAYRYRKGRLERRVDDTAVAAFERVAATANDEASMHLRRAWTAIYGRDPEPSLAYGEAVRAVEAVACPMFLPKDPRPTLGKPSLACAIGQMTGTSSFMANARHRELPHCGPCSSFFGRRTGLVMPAVRMHEISFSPRPKSAFPWPSLLCSGSQVDSSAHEIMLSQADRGVGACHFRIIRYAVWTVGY